MVFQPRRVLVSYVALSLVSMSYVSPAHAVSDSDLEEFGDVMQYVLPLAGLGLTAAYRDKEGAKQWGWSGLTSLGTTTALKGVYGKIRPNASDSATSFPSGHTTAAFFGASFMDMRYGRWWGIPAYFLAGLTAYGRVVSDNHHVDDTVMGASISMFSSWYWITPYDESAVSLVPFQANDAYGVSLRFNQGGKPADDSGLDDNHRWRYALIFGPASQNKNAVKSPTATGTEFDLAGFQGTNDPTTTANAIIERYQGRHLTQFSIEPFEVRDFGQFAQPTLFNNTTFLPTEDIRSEFRLTDIRLQYYYDFLPKSPVIFQAGGGLSYQHTTVEIATTDAVKADKVSSDVWIPLVNATLGYQFTPRISLRAELTGLSVGDQKQLDAGVTLGYRLNKYWDTGISYSIYEHETETNDLRNSLEFDIIALHVGYSFY